MEKLSLSAATAWLVVNGYSRPEPMQCTVSEERTELVFESAGKTWTLLTAGDEGMSSLVITPEGGPIDEADDCSDYSDCWLALIFEDELLREAYAGETWNGCSMAEVVQLPESGEDIGQLLELTKKLFRRVALAMNVQGDIGAAIEYFIATDPEASQLLGPVAEENE